MKQLTYPATALLVAFAALLMLTGAVRSSPPPSRVAELPVGPNFVYARAVTITVGSSDVPLTPALTSRWQFETSDQIISGTYQIPLPDDAYAISVDLPITMYHIDPGPTLVITGPQPDFYFEYQTNERALRFGNQVLISQTASNNQEYHYLSTLIFTEPYQYLGTSGFAPTKTTASTISWDAIPDLGPDARYRFFASTWLWDPRLVPPTLPRPDLEIVTATMHSQLDRIDLTATIRNNGPMTAWAPAYINLYDRLAPSVPPAGPLDLADGWCSLAPISSCGGGDNNPIPAVPKGQTVIFTTGYDLSAILGQHDIYLFIDALGGNLGLNVESSENNNFIFVGSVRRGLAVFLPLIRR